MVHDVHGGERGGEVVDSLLDMWVLVSLLGARRLAQAPRHFHQLFICKKSILCLYEGKGSK